MTVNRFGSLDLSVRIRVAELVTCKEVANTFGQLMLIGPDTIDTVTICEGSVMLLKTSGSLTCIPCLQGNYT